MLNITDPREVTLSTGTVRVRVDRARWPLDTLCAFAARRNPRRGFLVVSRVLGRHLPTPPAVMRQSARDLAALLPADLPGPVLVVGLAETAVCLGQTVHREFAALTGRDDLCFIHSTRQQIDAPLLCRFEEPHSHASAHLIYRPAFAAPRSLVLVDDEVSTGTTLTNLATALVGAWPGVETIIGAALADWSGGGWLAAMPRPARSVALLEGRLDWTPDPAAQAEPELAGSGSLGRLAEHRNRGRLGLQGSAIDQPPLPDLPPASRLRIVGTGEFTFPPFLLAERLAAAGHDVVVQATSRSPARLGGAMRHAIAFEDNYDTGVPNFLYNAADDGRINWVCHETPVGSVDPALLKALDATSVRWPA